MRDWVVEIGDERLGTGNWEVDLCNGTYEVGIPSKNHGVRNLRDTISEIHKMKKGVQKLILNSFFLYQ